jgi:hypothetical protein
MDTFSLHFLAAHPLANILTTIAANACNWQYILPFNSLATGAQHSPVRCNSVVIGPFSLVKKMARGMTGAQLSPVLYQLVARGAQFSHSQLLLIFPSYSPPTDPHYHLFTAVFPA